MTEKEYPAWVCIRCGTKYAKKPCGTATWHYGQCDVCGKKAQVTEPRDFGHLKDGWQYEKENQIALEEQQAKAHARTLDMIATMNETRRGEK